MTSTLLGPMIDRLIPVRQDVLRIPLQLALGVVLMALLAQVRLEIGPVPITGQTLGVLLIGAAYGMRLGGLTMVLYLAVGGLGVGVFAGGAAGWATLSGATAGYLLSFPLAAGLIGLLAQRGWDKRFSTTALAMLLGNLVIYTFGLLWLSRFAPDLSTTMQWGLIPFLPGDILKLLFAALLLPLVWRLLGGRRT